MLRLFNKKIDREDWSEVYSSADAWEAELIKSALLVEDIQAKVKCVKGDDGKSERSGLPERAGRGGAGHRGH